VRIYLFGYLSNDFYGRVIVTPDDQTVARLAEQLTAWGPAPERPGPFAVTNEAGEALDPAHTIAGAGLANGDIFTVAPARPPRPARPPPPWRAPSIGPASPR
jgi:hypothetical protein